MCFYDEAHRLQVLQKLAIANTVRKPAVGPHPAPEAVGKRQIQIDVTVTAPIEVLTEVHYMNGNTSWAQQIEECLCKRVNVQYMFTDGI